MLSAWLIVGGGLYASSGARSAKVLLAWLIHSGVGMKRALISCVVLLCALTGSLGSPSDAIREMIRGGIDMIGCSNTHAVRIGLQGHMRPDRPDKSVATGSAPIDEYQRKTQVLRTDTKRQVCDCHTSLPFRAC